MAEYDYIVLELAKHAGEIMRKQEDNVIKEMLQESIDEPCNFCGTKFKCQRTPICTNYP